MSTSHPFTTCQLQMPSLFSIFYFCFKKASSRNFASVSFFVFVCVSISVPHSSGFSHHQPLLPLCCRPLSIHPSIITVRPLLLLLLLIERNPWDYFDIGIPYPTGFHPRSHSDVTQWQDFVRARKHNTLFCFAGAPRGEIKNDFRGLLLS